MKIMLGRGKCNKEEGIRVKKQSAPPHLLVVRGCSAPLWPSWFLATQSLLTQSSCSSPLSWMLACCYLVPMSSCLGLSTCLKMTRYGTINMKHVLCKCWVSSYSHWSKGKALSSWSLYPVVLSCAISLWELIMDRVI